MGFFKTILIYFVFAAIYYFFYHFFGFEYTIILGIVQIVSILTINDYKKHKKTQPHKQVYMKPNTRMKF